MSFHAISCFKDFGRKSFANCWKIIFLEISSTVNAFVGNIKNNAQETSVTNIASDFSRNKDQYLSQSLYLHQRLNENESPLKMMNFRVFRKLKINSVCSLPSAIARRATAKPFCFQSYATRMSAVYNTLHLHQPWEWKFPRGLYSALYNQSSYVNRGICTAKKYKCCCWKHTSWKTFHFNAQHGQLFYWRVR